jgi:hypothetical protein
MKSDEIERTGTGNILGTIQYLLGKNVNRRIEPIMEMP